MRPMVAKVKQVYADLLEAFPIEADLLATPDALIIAASVIVLAEAQTRANA